MAELSVGTLEMTITADGGAAISELERVQSAAEGAAQNLSGIGDKANLDRVAGEAGGAAEGVGKVGDAAAKAGKSMKELGESLSKAGTKLTTFVSLPIAGLMTAAVKGASDLTETIGKTEVVFGQLSGRVMEWSNTSVQAMGLAQGSALEFASTYGDMATGMGLPIQTATEMSMSLTQLAADMASFKNISTEVAAQKLNAVFTGETEGLKSLGIVMTQTNLQAFALSQGITKSVQSMSQAEQVTLRYRYVMEATKNAQGDFARTGDSLANQSRKLGETMKQLGESFGAQLVPMVTPVVERLQQLAQSISELDSGTKNTILSIAAVAAAIGPVLLIGGKLITFIATLQGALTALSINPVILGLAALAAAVAGVVALKGALDEASGIAETGEAYERVRRQFEEPIEVNVDDTELSKLDGVEDPKTANVNVEMTGGDALEKLEDGTYTETVTIVPEGEDKLNAIKGTIDTMMETDYGKVTINGETTDIDADIEQIGTAIEALSGDVKFTSDGTVVIGEGGGDAIAAIQAKIAELEGKVAFVEDPEARATLDAQITALKTQLDALGAGKEVTVTVIEGGEQKLADLKSAAEALGEGTYNMVIGDNAAEVGAKISAIKTDIENLQGNATITTDGTVYLEGGGDAIQAIQEKIGELEGEVKIMADGTAKDALLQDIQTLKTALDGLGDKNVTVTYSDPNEAAKNAEAFKTALAGLPENKTYAATGEFNVDESSMELLTEYANAVAAAATATGDYASAVDAMNKVVDTDTQEKVKQVNEELASTMEGYVGQLNDGVITEQQYGELSAQAIKDATEKRSAIEAQAKAQKEANQVFADGNRENDYGAMADRYKDIYKDSHVSQEQTGAALSKVKSTMDSGGDLTEISTDMQTLLAGRGNTAQAQIEALNTAMTEYNTQMAAADEKTAAADAAFEKQSQAISESAGIWEDYNMYASDTNLTLEEARDMALQNAEQNGASAEAMNAFSEAVVNADGSLVGYGDSFSALQAIEDQQATAEQKHTEALAAADEQRQGALETLQSTAEQVAAMQDVGDVHFGTDALSGELDTIAASGVEVTDSMGDMITGAQTAAEGLVSAFDGADPAAAIAKWATDFETTGSQLTAGLANGLGNTGEATSAADALGSEAANAVASGAGCASPSTKTQETGQNMVAGLANGLGSTGEATSAAEALGQAAVDAAAQTAGDASSVGEALDSSAASGMDGGQLTSAAEGAVSSAASSAGSGASSAGQQIGSSLIQGAASGVMSAAGQLAAQAAAAVRAAIAAAKAEANIQSPSRVMRDEVGVMLTRGISVGVEKEVPTAQKRMQEAVRGLTAGARREVIRTATPAAAAAGPGINYEAMGTAMQDAMREVRFGFQIGERELAQSTALANNVALTAQQKRMNARYGGRR